MAGHRFTCLRTGIYIIWKCCYLPNTRGIRTDRSERFNVCHKLLLLSLHFNISVRLTGIHRMPMQNRQISSLILYSFLSANTIEPERYFTFRTRRIPSIMPRLWKPSSVRCWLMSISVYA